MNQWFAALSLLAVMQIWFYQIDPKKTLKSALFYWGAVYLGLLGCEFTAKRYIEFQIEWWIFVTVCFMSVVIGEIAEVLALSVGKSIERKRQSLPSFYSFSVLYLSFVWLSSGHHEFFYQSQIEIIIVATFALLFLALLSGIHERLQLVTVPKHLRGLPILVISAGLFLLIFLK